MATWYTYAVPSWEIELDQIEDEMDLNTVWNSIMNVNSINMNNGLLTKKWIFMKNWATLEVLLPNFCTRYHIPQLRTFGVLPTSNVMIPWAYFTDMLTPTRSIS